MGLESIGITSMALGLIGVTSIGVASIALKSIGVTSIGVTSIAPDRGNCHDKLPGDS